MSGPNVAPSPEMAALAAERNALWRAYDDAMGNVGSLGNLAHRLPAGSASAHADTLTAERTPPAELAASINRLEQQLHAISQTERQISASQADIDRIRRNDRLLLGILIVLGILLVLLAAHAIRVL